MITEWDQLTKSVPTGTIGNEGKIIRTNIVPCIIYCAIVVIVLGGAMLMGINPVPLNG